MIVFALVGVSMFARVSASVSAMRLWGSVSAPVWVGVYLAVSARTGSMVAGILLVSLACSLSRRRFSLPGRLMPLRFLLRKNQRALCRKSKGQLSSLPTLIRHLLLLVLFLINCVAGGLAPAVTALSFRKIGV